MRLTRHCATPPLADATFRAQPLQIKFPGLWQRAASPGRTRASKATESAGQPSRNRHQD